jgi:hypothetical protein
MGETSAGHVKRILKTQTILESELIPSIKGSATTAAELQNVGAILVQSELR